MRLANTKSKNETGLDFVLRSINVQTSFGIKRMKKVVPFVPGQESALRHEFEKTNKFIHILDKEKRNVSLLLQEFMEVKEILFTLERSDKNVLSMVELFEVKNLLLRTEKIKGIMEILVPDPPEEFRLESTISLLDTLDPRRDRINTFYVYDEFHKDLAPLRGEKRELELAIRKERKNQKGILEEKYNLAFTPKFECVIQKSNEQALSVARGTGELEMASQDYMTVTFLIKPTELVYEMSRKMDGVIERLEEIELQVRQTLSAEIGAAKDTLISNCDKIGEMDFALAKAFYAREHGCVEPEIVTEHLLEFHEGRHLEVEDILLKKGKSYCPVSIALNPGVACITGANMGGKTVCLKLVGLVALLAQHGFFVPCKWAKLGLSSYVHILIGDSQSLQRGLSSFGSEMEELKELMDNSKDRALVLIDEIASGTNPTEGLALTKAIIDYLSDRPYISFMATHFDRVNTSPAGQNMQVIGLANADFNKLDKEIRYANRKERIEIVGKYMDYNLRKLEGDEKVSRDAINIAKMLGISEEIINNAKKYM